MSDINKDAKEVVLAVVKIVLAGFEVMEDGKIGFDDLSKIGKVIPDILKGFSGFDVALEEFKDLNSEEYKELIELVADELATSIEDEKVIAYIEVALEIVYSLQKAFEISKS